MTSLVNYTHFYLLSKSFTMMGTENPAEFGLIPRICFGLFECNYISLPTTLTFLLQILKVLNRIMKTNVLST
jgi:hypothetical protein